MSKRKNSLKKLDSQVPLGISVRTALPLGMLAGVAIIAAAIFFAYLPSINGGFVFDDDQVLTDNNLIKATDGPYRFWCTTETLDYWPMTYTTFWIEWRLWEMRPTGYHVTNLMLHIVESLLIWIILRKLSMPGAFLAALFFAIHPVNAESVAWIAQRKNLMAMLFFLPSILCYLKSEEKTPSTSAGVKHGSMTLLLLQSMNVWYALSLLNFVLAMLSKGSVAMLPFLLLLIVWWLRPLTKWDLLRTAPFFLVAAVLAGVNIWFQTHGSGEMLRNAGFAERLLGAGGMAWFYLYKAFLPVDLAFIYPTWRIETGNPLWWLPLFSALLVTAVLWRYGKSWSRPLLFAWGFFCTALLPVLGFADVGFMRFSLVADRYQHIALIGVIALISAGFSAWHRRVRGAMRREAIVIALLTTAVLTFLTWRQSDLYRDPMILYQATLEKNPDCWMAHNNLGIALSNTGRMQDAMEHYRQALRLKPDFAEAYINLGAALGKTGRPQQAIEQYEQALRIKPDFPDAHYNLGNSFKEAGQYQKAIEHFQKAIKLKPDFAEAHLNLGNALLDANQIQEAIEHYLQVLRLKPYHVNAHYNLGNAYKTTGQYQKAIEHYRQVLLLRIDYPEAHNNLGTILIQTGRVQEAIEHFEQAIKLNPAYSEACNNLGAALVKTGRPQDAIEHFKQALMIRPDDMHVYQNLALAYAMTHKSSEAITAAQNAMELAHSQGKTAQARQIEDWLNSYRAGLSALPNTPPTSKSATPP